MLSVVDKCNDSQCVIDYQKGVINMSKKKIAVGIVATVIVMMIMIRIFALFFDFLGIGGGKNVVNVRVNDGATLSSITADLKETGIIKSEFMFKLYSKISGAAVYQMGRHSFKPSMSYGKIKEELERIPNEEGVKITIPEGYELRQIADKLEAEGLIDRDVFEDEIQNGDFDYDFVKEIPQRENRLEGYLYPDTYIISENDSEHRIISMMLDNFYEKVIPIYENSDKSKTIDDVIKLASVIEREAAGDDDRDIVASVFVNRINNGMKLESCATVQYILKERKAVLSNADTLIDSPYNTYMYGGLPIGPIASPGAASVEAALYPAQSDYMYFFANDDGSGSVFSVTYEEHMQKLREMQN